MYLLAKSGGHESYGNGNINSYINFYMITLEAVDFTASICHLRDFQNQEFYLTTLKSRTRQGEKKGGEHKQLRIVMHITQTQKAFCLTK